MSNTPIYDKIVAEVEQYGAPLVDGKLPARPAAKKTAAKKTAAPRKTAAKKRTPAKRA